MAKEKLKPFDRDLPVALTVEEKATKGLDLAKLINKRVKPEERQQELELEKPKPRAADAA